MVLQFRSQPLRHPRTTNRTQEDPSPSIRALFMGDPIANLAHVRIRTNLSLGLAALNRAHADARAGHDPAPVSRPFSIRSGAAHAIRAPTILPRADLDSGPAAMSRDRPDDRPRAAHEQAFVTRRVYEVRSGSVGNVAARERIAQLRKENEQSAQRAPLRFSRNCPICRESPLQRASFTCGHIVCLACAEQMKLDAARRSQKCPICRKKCDFHRLFEEQIEEETAMAE